MPIRFSAPSFATISYGNDFVRWRSSATGATSPSANSLTVRLISSWSGDRSKSTWLILSALRGLGSTMNRARLIFDMLKRGRTYSYGQHRSQRADLHLPAGPGPHPVIVLIHGGSWSARYGRIVM